MNDMEKTKEALIEELVSLREDVAKQTDAANTFKQQQKRISDILSSISVGIMLVDANTRDIMAANPALLALIGASEERVLGQDRKTFLPIADDGPEQIIIDANGSRIDIIQGVANIKLSDKECIIISCIDNTLRKQMEEEREDLITNLKEAIADVKVLSGLIPICCKCHKIRNDKNYWQTVESYIESVSDAIFTHGYCKECAADVMRELEEIESE